MRRLQSGQALVEWAAASFVLLFFVLGILAVGEIVGEDMAVRSAATQAAFAAARAPSADAAQKAAYQAAGEAMTGSRVQDFHLALDLAGFQRGGILTVTAEGYLSLAEFPIVSQALGQRIKLTWQAQALIEPYRSRAG